MNIKNLLLKSLFVAFISTPLSAGIWLKGGNVVDVKRGVAEKRDLFICNGVIVEKMAKGCSYAQVDAAGKWIIPALRDMHVHARGQSGGDGNYFEAMSGTREAKLFLAAGVSGFLDAMKDEAVIFPERDTQRAAERGYLGADIFCSGAAFTPTGGHGTEPDYDLPKTATRIVDSVEDAEREVIAIARRKPDVVKIMYDHRGFNGERVADGAPGALGIAMKKDVMRRIVATAIGLGLKPYVHIGVWDDARDAIEAGAKIINHLGETEIPDDVVAMAKRNHVYWIPTLALYHEYLNIIRDPKLLDDPLLKKVARKEAIDSYRPENIYYDKDYVAYQKRHASDKISVRKLLKAGVKLVAGSDTVELGTFPGWSLHREMVLLTEYGLSSSEALSAATITAGEMIDKNYGLSPGAEGSVLVLDASPLDDIWNTTMIKMIIHRGHIINSGGIK